MQPNTILQLYALLLLLSGSTVALAEQTFEPKRLANGQPDLQGIWSNASLTTMERETAWDQLVIPPTEIEQVTTTSFWSTYIREDSGPTKPTEGKPNDREVWRGYNGFWIDPGSSYSLVKGELRTSWITEPSNGKVPYNELGKALRNNPFPNRDPVGEFDGPEARPLGDRCIVSYANALGPPLNNHIYNNHYQIVQTNNQVMIMAEMNHDFRIIAIDGKHKPDPVREWFGSSVARWEHDTLIINTKNVHPVQGKRGRYLLSPKATIEERFSLQPNNTLLYEFLIDDPTYYAQTWRGEMTLVKEDTVIYEYACHEGNYALTGILAGARQKEGEANLSE